MYGFAAIVCLAGVLFWLDPILQAVAPSRIPAAPTLRRTPRPAINEALLALEDAADAGIACPADAYTVHIYSKAPLVLYVENFLSLDERKHLLAISDAIYEPSTVTHNGGATVQRDVLVRDSEVAVVPRTDVVRCIEARARRLQGWRDDLWLELLRVQRYVAPSGHYGYHYDWSRSGAATGGWGRVSSLMVFVDDGELSSSARTSASTSTSTYVPLKGGGTAFPRLPRRSSDKRWCRFIGCDGDGLSFASASGSGSETESGSESESESELDGPAIDGDGRDNTTGVIFKPVAGNAVFWENFRPDGSGRAFEETWHAGLRVQEGIKVGLNIWSWGRMD